MNSVTAKFLLPSVLGIYVQVLILSIIEATNYFVWFYIIHRVFITVLELNTKMAILKWQHELSIVSTLLTRYLPSSSYWTKVLYILHMLVLN